MNIIIYFILFIIAFTTMFVSLSHISIMVQPIEEEIKKNIKLRIIIIFIYILFILIQIPIWALFYKIENILF